MKEEWAFFLDERGRKKYNELCRKCERSCKQSLENLEYRRKKLTDMLLDEQITKEAYDEKYDEMSAKIQKSKDTIEILQSNVDDKKDIAKRLNAMKKALTEGDVLEKFDRVVFESIVDKVIVGEVNEDGTVDPYKLTFVMKGNGNTAIPNAKQHFKESAS